MAQRYSTRTEPAYPTYRQVAVPALALIGVNILLMYLVAETPLAAVNEALFSVPILGLLVYGAALTGGNILAERGIEQGATLMMGLGVGLLQGAYALFGGGILAALNPGARELAVAVTILGTVALTAGLAGYVYLRDRNFSHWARWSLGAFAVGAGFVLVGTFLDVILILGFACIFAGFLLRLGYEIWHVRASYDPDRSLIHALGIYVAFTGVFVHILQIVARIMLDR